ncbi:unnamed protein product [Sphagnum jensenii]|uniref:Uncharacterized protein n=1 Tax=Sphagnum jensenii TaxID=128206 RepID=A0ABP1BMV2_9BRYO
MLLCFSVFKDLGRACSESGPQFISSGDVTLTMAGITATASSLTERTSSLVIATVAPPVARCSFGSRRLGFERARKQSKSRRCNPRHSISIGNRNLSRHLQRLNLSAKVGDGFDGDDKAEHSEGKNDPVDWDKAWSNFPKSKMKESGFSLKSFLKLDMDQYVSRKPNHSKYPLSEEVDPLRRTERGTLNAWTDPKFTVAGFGVIVGLFLYMVVIVGPPPV